jgi:hypothetical protein
MAEIGSHSADVKMWLDCGLYGEVELSRITPTSVVAKSPREIPPCIAELIVTIDGARVQNRVELRGFSKGRAVALIRLIGEVLPF